MLNKYLFSTWMNSRPHESGTDEWQEAGQVCFLKWRDYHLLLQGKTIKPTLESRPGKNLRATGATSGLSASPRVTWHLEANLLLWANKGWPPLLQGQENLPILGGQWAETLVPQLCLVLLYITSFNFPNYPADVSMISSLWMRKPRLWRVEALAWDTH